MHDLPAEKPAGRTASLAGGNSRTFFVEIEQDAVALGGWRQRANREPPPPRQTDYLTIFGCHPEIIRVSIDVENVTARVPAAVR